jgi:glyoxalase family protein
VAGPHQNGAYENIIFTDPDGVILELTTRGPGFQTVLAGPHGEGHSSLTETWPEPVTEITPDMQIRGIHHIAPITRDMRRTQEFYEGVLGIPCIARHEYPNNPAISRSFFSPRGGEPGTVLAYIGVDPNEPVQRGYIGHGVTHHFAFEVGDVEAQEFWRERLRQHGLEVTPILDRKYFRSIYFADPDGHILEMATTGPGFLVDQSREELGKELALPPWLEGQRQTIEQHLAPIRLS